MKMKTIGFFFSLSEMILYLLDPEKSLSTLTSPANGAALSDSTPQLTWDVLSYSVEDQAQLGDSSFSSIEIDAATPSTSYTTGTLVDGTHYRRVRGRNAAGERGAWSFVLSFTVDIGVESTTIPPHQTQSPKRNHQPPVQALIAIFLFGLLSMGIVHAMRWRRK